MMRDDVFKVISNAADQLESERDCPSAQLASSVLLATMYALQSGSERGLAMTVNAWLNAPEPPPQGSIVEALDELREAGGKAWNGVADVDAELGRLSPLAALFDHDQGAAVSQAVLAWQTRQGGSIGDDEETVGGVLAAICMEYLAKPEPGPATRAMLRDIASAFKDASRLQAEQIRISFGLEQMNAVLAEQEGER